MEASPRRRVSASDYIPFIAVCYGWYGRANNRYDGRYHGLCLIWFNVPCQSWRSLNHSHLPLRHDGLDCRLLLCSVYKLMHGKLWKRSTFLTAALFPSLVGFVVLLINAAAAYERLFRYYSFQYTACRHSSVAGCVSPLVLVGSYYGFRKETIEVPVRTNQINRHIPEQLWYTHPFFGIALGGILPFGAVCIELFFIMSAMWLHQMYYVFGFLFIVFIILIITCAEITIVLCYFQLCNEAIAGGGEASSARVAVPSTSYYTARGITALSSKSLASSLASCISYTC